MPTMISTSQLHKQYNELALASSDMSMDSPNASFISLGPLVLFLVAVMLLTLPGPRIRVEVVAGVGMLFHTLCQHLWLHSKLCRSSRLHWLLLLLLLCLVLKSIRGRSPAADKEPAKPQPAKPQPISVQEKPLETKAGPIIQVAVSLPTLITAAAPSQAPDTATASMKQATVRKSSGGTENNRYICFFTQAGRCHHLSEKCALSSSKMKVIASCLQPDLPRRCETPCKRCVGHEVHVTPTGRAYHTDDCKCISSRAQSKKVTEKVQLRGGLPRRISGACKLCSSHARSTTSGTPMLGDGEKDRANMCPKKLDFGTQTDQI